MMREQPPDASAETPGTLVLHATDLDPPRDLQLQIPASWLEPMWGSAWVDWLLPCKGGSGTWHKHGQRGLKWLLLSQLIQRTSMCRGSVIPLATYTILDHRLPHYPNNNKPSSSTAAISEERQLQGLFPPCCLRASGPL